MNSEQRAFIEELYAIATEGDVMTRDEARTLIRSVRSKTAEGLPDAISNVVGWAHKVRGQQAILDVILRLGEAGAIEVQWQDGEPALKMCLPPEDISIRR